MSDPSLTNEPVKALDPVPGDGHEPGPALVRIERLTKSFGSKIALKDVPFSVPAGQICGLLGPNGAGKTTLFRLLMGILKATEGKLTIARGRRACHRGWRLSGKSARDCRRGAMAMAQPVSRRPLAPHFLFFHRCGYLLDSVRRNDGRCCLV